MVEAEQRRTSRVLGFTGPRLVPVPTVASRRIIAGSLRGLDDVAEFVTGAAVGVDALIGAGCARRYPNARHTVIIPAIGSQVSLWWLGANVPHLTLIQMSPGTSFKQRNQAIVARSTELFGYPAAPEHDPVSYRSGTWQTIRLARRAGLPVTLYDLNPPVG